MTDLRLELLRFLRSHRGRALAVTRDAALFHLQAHEPALGDRQLRDLYSTMPICSTASKPYGLYLPATRAEVDEFLGEYGCHVHPSKVAERKSVFVKAYPEWYPETRQMDLFGGGA